MNILEFCFIQHLEGEDTSLAIKPKKCFFLTTFKHLKPKIDYKNNRNFKHIFLGNLDFAFTILITNGAEFHIQHNYIIKIKNCINLGMHVFSSAQN